MSNYYRITKHPKTGKFMQAEFLDDYFGKHNYGVRFDQEKVYRENEHEWEFEEVTPSESMGLKPKWLDDHARAYNDGECECTCFKQGYYEGVIQGLKDGLAILKS